MKDLSPEEAGRWMDAAPQIVQDAVTSPATGQVLEDLSKKYQLHIDVSGLLEKLTSYVLLGYVGPEEFLKEMLAAGVSDADARQIMSEINQKIFVPLRKEEEEVGVVEVEQSVKTVEAPKSVMPIRIPSVENKSAPHIAPLPPKISMSSAAILPRSNPAFMISSQESLEASKLLEDHEEPHVELNKIPVPQAIPQQIPEVPANLPGVVLEPEPAIVLEPEVEVVPVMPEPVVVPMPKPAPAPQPQVKPLTPIAPITSYSADPYRESIDEA